MKTERILQGYQETWYELHLTSTSGSTSASKTYFLTKHQLEEATRIHEKLFGTKPSYTEVQVIVDKKRASKGQVVEIHKVEANGLAHLKKLKKS